MTSHIISSDADRHNLAKFIDSQPFPFTVDVTKGKRRSNAQNHLQRLWMNEISAYLGDQTPEEVRGFCKLTEGVPILRAENEVFCEKYDRIIKPLPYETKIEMMMEPLDFPVTRLMTVDQKTRYLDRINMASAARGIILTQPEERA